MLESLGSHRQPLSALRACLIDEFDTLRTSSANTVSRVYVHLPQGAGLTHNYYYYYRVFDQWERLESPSDADLFTRLFVPNHRAVTLITEHDYTSFLQRIGSPGAGRGVASPDRSSVGIRRSSPATVPASSPVPSPPLYGSVAPARAKCCSCCRAPCHAAPMSPSAKAGYSFAVDDRGAGIRLSIALATSSSSQPILHGFNASCCAFGPSISGSVNYLARKRNSRRSLTVLP